MSKLFLYYPCKPLRINQGWGTGSHYYAQFGMKGHNGYDFFAPDSTEVRAAHDGEITYAGEDGSNGLLVVLRTIDKFDYLNGESFYKTVYGHLKKKTFKIKAGEKVKAGQLLALANNTGASTGSHLHFGLKPVMQGEQDWQWYNLEQDAGYNGAIDPTPYFNGKFAKDVSSQTVDIGYKFNKNLGVYSVGMDVRELQRRLVSEGYGDFTPTGFFGPKTRDAVVRYQITKDIRPITGFCGSLTRQALNL